MRGDTACRCFLVWLAVQLPLKFITCCQTRVAISSSVSTSVVVVGTTERMGLGLHMRQRGCRGRSRGGWRGNSDRGSRGRSGSGNGCRSRSGGSAGRRVTLEAEATVNADPLPGDVAGTVRGDEDGRKRDFIHSPQAAHRDLLLELLLVPIQRTRQQQARLHHVHRHAVLREVCRRRSNEAQ